MVTEDKKKSVLDAIAEYRAVLDTLEAAVTRETMSCREVVEAAKFGRLEAKIREMVGKLVEGADKFHHADGSVNEEMLSWHVGWWRSARRG